MLYLKSFKRNYISIYDNVFNEYEDCRIYEKWGIFVDNETVINIVIMFEKNGDIDNRKEFGKYCIVNFRREELFKMNK